MGDLKMFDKVTVWAMVIMVGLVSFTTAEVDPSCTDPLEPCVQFLNNTDDVPSVACCNPMRQMVANDIPCLCFLLFTPEALESLNSNFEEANRIVESCAPSFDLDACKLPEDNGDNGDNGDNKDNGKTGKPKNDAKKLTLTGFTSLLMFLISLVF